MPTTARAKTRRQSIHDGYPLLNELIGEMIAIFSSHPSAAESLAVKRVIKKALLLSQTRERSRCENIARGMAETLWGQSRTEKQETMLAGLCDSIAARIRSGK